MNETVSNLLYRKPELYERIYPEPNEETPQMCLKMIKRFFSGIPATALDVGCGTGRDLAVISRTIPDCTGIDYLQENIAYARHIRPGIEWLQGDMRSFRSGKKYDVIMCMGSALMYSLTNEELEQTLKTFAVHSHPGTILILDINNAASFLGEGNFRETVSSEVDLAEIRAKVTSVHTFDHKNQIMLRRRLWETVQGERIEDFCRYRLLFPQEMRYFLSMHGFEVKGMFDNKELEDSNLDGKRLYIAAIWSKG